MTNDVLLEQASTLIREQQERIKSLETQNKEFIEALSEASIALRSCYRLFAATELSPVVGLVDLNSFREDAEKHLTDMSNKDFFFLLLN